MSRISTAPFFDPRISLESLPPDAVTRWRLPQGPRPRIHHSIKEDITGITAVNLLCHNDRLMLSKHVRVVLERIHVIGRDTKAYTFLGSSNSIVESKRILYTPIDEFYPSTDRAGILSLELRCPTVVPSSFFTGVGIVMGDA